MQKFNTKMMQLSSCIKPEFRQSRRLLFTSSRRAVYELVGPKQTPTAGVAITSRLKKLNFPPFIKVKFVITSTDREESRAVSRVLFQDIFCGKFNKSMLNYAEVLNYDRHRALGHRIDQINQYFGENKGLL